MNHSAILDMLDFTTLFDNAICLTPARRRKLSVDLPNRQTTCAEIETRLDLV